MFARRFVFLAHESADGITDARVEVLAVGSDPSNVTVTDAFETTVLGFLDDTPASPG